MALKMRDDRNGKNNKRRKEDPGKQSEGCQESDLQYVNGDMSNSSLIAFEGPETERQVQKRIEHNEVEKRRKDKIKQGITKIGKILPFMTVAERKANGNVSERSTFCILEKAAEYIKDLKDQTDKFLQEKGTEVQAEEIIKLKAELCEVREEKDKFENQLKAAGIHTDFSANWSYKKFDGLENLPGCDDGLDRDLGFPLTSPDVSELKNVECNQKKKGSKSRRKNTISAQLEEKHQSAAQDQQKTVVSEANLMAGTNFGMMGFSQNAAMNPQMLNAAMFGGSVPQGQGQLILPAMNIINPGAINPAAINAASLNPSTMNTGTLNQGALNPAAINPHLVQNVGIDRSNGMVPYMSPNTNLSAFTQNSNMTDGFGLLQMAMRDAGIVASSLPSNVSQTPQGTSLVPTSSITSVNKSNASSKESSAGTASPLQTLASVATETICSSVSNAIAPSSMHQVVTNSHSVAGPFNTNSTQAMNLNMPIMTPNGIMQTLNPNLGLQMMAQNPAMPFNIMQNGGLSGMPMMPQQQGQIIYLNEQGIPVISNVPFQGMDGQPQIATMSQNSSLLKPGSAVQGNLQNVQKDPKTMQDTVSGDSQVQNNLFQLPANAMQAQSQMQSHDIAAQQAQANKINPNNTDPIFQAQQQFNQQLLQASQMSGLMQGQPLNMNPQNVNVVSNLQKVDNGSSNASTGDNLMLPVSQNGNLLTINQTASAQMQLPSALILPNGQIIPVVTQPQLLAGQNQQASVNVMNPGANVVHKKPPNNGTVTTPSSTQAKETTTNTSNSPATTRQTGLLMTTNTVVTAPNRPVSTSVAALSTTVVPTTVTGSIMSTQVQKQHQANSKAAIVTHQQPMNGLTGMLPSNSSNAQMFQAQSVPLPAENNSCIPGSNTMTMMQSNQLISNGGAIVITLPNGPGQPPTSVLVDPITFQVLGTLPQQQQQQQQLPQQNFQQIQQNALPPPPVHTPDTASKAVTDNDTGKKPSKKGSHRALKPKPSTAKSRAIKSPQPSGVISSTIGEEKSDKKDTSTSDSPSTDILAQATESLFSDISPSISNFYNPANEDNPLHIDTSAGDTEEDAVAVSPKKDRLQNSQAVYNKQPSTTFNMTDPSTSPYHFIESPPTVKEVAKKSKSKKSSAPSSQKTSTKKSNKKNSSSKKNQNKEKGEAGSKEIEDKQKETDSLESNKNDAVPFEQLPDVVEMFKDQTNGKVNDSQPSSQMETASSSTAYQSLFSSEEPSKDFSQNETSVEAIIPASINFTENEICDVLDQVEKLGNSFTEETPVPVTPVSKKSKSRKNKNQTSIGEEEHSTKKKKKISHDDLESSLNVENILASMAVHVSSKTAKDSNCKKKSSESVQSLSNSVEETTLLLPSFSSDGPDKTTPPQKAKTNTDLASLSVSTESNMKNLSIENLSTPLQVSTDSPLMSPNVSQVVKSLDSAGKSPNFCSSLDIGSIQRTSEQKTDTMTQQNSDNKFNEFPSFFMPDNSEGSQISPVPQSLPCLSSDATVTLQGSLSQSSASTLTATTSCNLSTEQQPTNTVDITNSALLSNHQPNNRSSNNPLDNSGSHGAQSLAASMNSQLTYSAESLFSPASQLNALPDIRSELAPNSSQTAPPLMHPSSQVNTNPHNTSPELSRPRTSIYSAENFVQQSMNCESQPVPKQSYNRPQQDFSTSGSNRGNHMNITNDTFNFSNIASNVPSNNNRVRANNSSSSSSYNASSTNSFSFTLAGNPEASNNNFTSQIGHHQFPFYPLHPSVTTSQGGSTDPSPDMSRKTDQIEPVGFPPFQSNGRSPHFASPQMNPVQSHNQLSHDQSFANFTSPPEPSSGHRGGDNLFHNQPQITPPTAVDKGNSRPLSGNSNVRKQKDSSQNRGSQVSRSDQQDNQGINGMERSMFVSTGLPSFYTPNRQQMSGPSPLETPPLHHLPQSSSDTRMGSNSYQSSMSATNHPFSPEFSSVRIEGSSVQVQSGNPPYTQQQQNNPALEVNKHGRSKSKQVSDVSRRQGLISLDSQMAARGNNSRQQPQQHDHRPSHNPGNHTPTPSTHLEQQSPAGQPNRSQKAAKQSKSQQQARSKKSSKQAYNQDLDPSVPHPLFDTSQGMPSYFGIPNRSPPPSRSGQPDGPTYMSHFLGPSSRGLPNAVHKNPPELGRTFNQLFPQVRTQSSLGLNFQPGFGMNPVHGGHGSAAQIKGHPGAVSVTQPMSSFNLTNIFSDNCAQSNGGLNISPIKFPHGNTIIPPQPGMEHNTLQHNHQPGMLYHNRTPGPPTVLHNAMSINSLIGHNHHGMGQINNTMGQAFHGYGHPSSFAMPHLNFAMHEHGH